MDLHINLSFVQSGWSLTSVPGQIIIGRITISYTHRILLLTLVFIANPPCVLHSTASSQFAAAVNSVECHTACRLRTWRIILSSSKQTWVFIYDPTRQFCFEVTFSSLKKWKLIVKEPSVSVCVFNAMSRNRLKQNSDSVTDGKENSNNIQQPMDKIKCI